MSNSLLNENKPRNVAVDLLKILALFLMIFDHAYILLLKQPVPSLLRFFYEIVPLSPALFLFLSGYSSAISKAYLKRKKRLLSAAVYFAVSNVFFIVEHGFQFPHFPMATGILSTIALLVIFTVIMGLLPERIRFFLSFILSVIFTIVFVILRINKLKIFPLTYGYEPLFPTFLFGIIGFSFGLGKNQSVTKIFFLLFIGGVFGVVTRLFGIQKLFVSGGCYFTSYTFKYSNLVQNLLSDDIDGRYNVSIWNFDISCFFYVLSIVVLLVFVSEGILENKKIAGVITLPAKYLFIHYVLHLAVLTAVYGLLAGKTFSVPVFCIFISLLMITVYLVSVLLNRLYKKNYQGISPV